MTDLIVLMITVSTFVLFAGKKIPAFLRSIGKGLREIKFTGDNGYVEVDR